MILDQGEFGGDISSTSSPDGNLSYNETVESAMKVSEAPHPSQISTSYIHYFIILSNTLVLVAV